MKRHEQTGQAATMIEEHEKAFKPISPNPFIVGNPVRDPTMFFGREAEFDLVRRRFKDTTARGGLIVFSGERRSGKTSILFQILNGRLGPDFIPVLIDMQSMAIENEADFFQKIADQVVEELQNPELATGLMDFTAGTRPSAVFRSFVIKVLRTCPGRKLILLFDEYELFENKIDAGTLTEDVIYIMANLMETESFFLVFTGSLNLDQRRRDYWRLFLQRSIYQTISYLDRRDAFSLIENPVRGRMVYAPGVVEAIFRLTAGQPFYTQAVCQNIVDYLNEHRTTHATLEILRSVIDGIVSNPFPQMLFFWDGLGREEKLALALLAESLPEAEDRRRVSELIRRVSRKKYPIDLDTARLSTALESLFAKELLFKTDDAEPAYSFRIDLWRFWIRRMHSVWQVVRELGIEFRRPATRWRQFALGGAGVLLLGIVAWFVIPRAPAPEPAPVIPSTIVRINVEDPPTAAIYIDGDLMGKGICQQALKAGSHDFHVTAPGYRDSTFSREIRDGAAPIEWSIRLGELFGGVTVSTRPPGGRITVDGVDRGLQSRIDGLSVRMKHALTATLEGYAPVTREFDVRPDTVISLGTIEFQQVPASLTLRTDPPGARVRIDGAAYGQTPLDRNDLRPGTHRLEIRLEHHATLDTTIQLVEGSNAVDLRLSPERPGVLKIRGQTVAEVRVDGVLWMSTGYTRDREVEPGLHRFQVTFTSGESFTDSVQVDSGFYVEYNYTERTATKRPLQ